MESQGVSFINNLNDADLLMFTLESKFGGKTAYSNLSQLYKYLFKRIDMPIILSDRIDCSVTWFRDFEEIPNLKAIFKNFVIRPQHLNNSKLYNGRYHYQLLYDSLVNKDSKLMKETNNLNLDERDSVYPKKISKENLNKIKPVIWDWKNSYLNDEFRFLRNSDIDINRKREIDVFCVNNHRQGIQGWARKKAKNIVNNIPDTTTVTEKLEPKDYINKLMNSKVCVSCWGYGEWTHLDFYALYAGVVLIKPISSHVYLYPDLYQDNITYIPCSPDFSDLQEKVLMVLDDYGSYINMLKNNRKMLLNITEQDLVKMFCDSIKTFIN
jgi:hypothetical protein